jgi:uncharacterized DUF497 family protein
MQFEWDAKKDKSNREKHGISFSEAKVLFESSTDYLEIFDQPHSITEDRFIAIGAIVRGIIVVAWVEREDEAIRIISARLATRKEKQRFMRFLEKKND